MLIKLLNLNIFKGRFFENVVELIKKEDFDLVQVQEITGGKASNGGAYLFEEMKAQLSLQGELVSTQGLWEDDTAYNGNATFYKKSFLCLDKKVIWLSDYLKTKADFNDWAKIGRAAISLKLEIDGKQFYAINAHLAWGPNAKDEEYKIQQAEKLAEYLKTLDLPYILTGDFNVSPSTKVVGLFNLLARNLTSENNIQNTLNPKVHAAKQLFPLGLAVDYIFVSKEIKVKNFQVLQNDDLSDHLALTLEFEF